MEEFSSPPTATWKRSCFRISGGVSAPDFFDGLRRIDTDDGTTYLLNNKPVTEFPDETSAHDASA